MKFGLRKPSINGAIKIKGHVDSENSFGAKIRSAFTVTFNKNGTYTLKQIK